MADEIAPARHFTDPCLACGAVHRRTPDDEARHARGCVTCGAPKQCPPSSEFPVELRRFLTRQLLDRFLEQHGGPETGWRHLLAMMFRNTVITIPNRGDRFLDFAASPDDVYAVACRMAGVTFPTDSTGS